MFKKITLALGIATCFTINAQMFMTSGKTITKIVEKGEVTISKKFKNELTTPVNSIKVHWQVDENKIHSEQLTGLNISQNEMFEFTHKDLWNATAGNHSLKTWVSNVNGATGTKLIELNQVKVATTTVQRRPLYEMFTSSTCPPCYSFNYGYFNNFFATNHDDMTVIKYQMNWPGYGDNYYTSEGGSRRQYYAYAGGIPALFAEGSNVGTPYSSTTLTNNLSTYGANPSSFLVSSTHTINSTSKVIDIDITTMPYISGTYTLRVAVLETTTTGNVSSNGEAEFHNVMMKMVPNQNGTSINCNANTAINTSLSVNMTGTNIEDINDAVIAIFIQDDSNKDIMQSVMSIDAALGMNDNILLTNVSMYPNPSTNKIIIIESEDVLSMQIHNVLGKKVYAKEVVVNSEKINLSSLSTGVYMVSLKNQEGHSAVKKLILK